MPEYFDIVDSMDRVTRQATREAAHREGLWHRAIHVLLFNQQGEVFLQKRSMLKDTAPGCWDSSCSGHVDAGESYRTSAIRELGEELGLNPAPPIWPVFKTRACQETGWEFVWVYRGIANGPFTLHPEEISAGRWIRPDILDLEIEKNQDQFAVSFCYLWKGFRAFLRG